MNGLRARFFVIAVLLLANGILAALWLNGMFADRQNARRREDDLRQVLKNNGVTLGENFTWPDGTAYTLYYEADEDTARETAAALLGDVTATRKEDGAVRFESAAGWAEVSDVNDWYAVADAPSLRAALASNGFTGLVMEDDDTARQRFDGLTVVNGGWTAIRSDGQQTQIFGSWIGGTPKAVRDTQTRPADVCLLAYLGVADALPFTAVLKIELVYLDRPSQSLLIPAWMMVTDVDFVYIDAVTGEEMGFMDGAAV